jgi:flagellar biosynthesis regulator FlaF
MSVSSFCQDSSLDFSFRLAFDNQISLGCRRASIFSVLVWIYQKLVKIKVNNNNFKFSQDVCGEIIQVNLPV